LKKRAVVGVGVAGFPKNAAGNSWAFLQWATGLRELGWEVWMVESLQAKELIDRQGRPCRLGESLNLAHWKSILGDLDWNQQATLLVEGETVEEKGLKEFAQGADLFLNLSGHFKRQDLVAGAAARVYVDLDPAFTQIWSQVYRSPMNFEGHNAFWSVGLSMGRGAVVPDTGHDWKPVLPPVCRRYWSPETAGEGSGSAAEKGRGHWTTVTHWYGYAAVEWDGKSHGNKAEEFESLRNWPRETGLQPRVVTDLGPGEERSRFKAAGWQFLEPADICSDWKAYRSFLGASRGEFSPAKSGYITAKTGWFSDRSAMYLALGRPVLLQETGWSKWLPEGRGLVAFRTPEEAAERAREMEASHGQQVRAAEEIARDHLAAEKAIGQALQYL
jgi:hypothetical protein